ncbi:hypothetical protein [Clostridium sp. JN-1]|uniref:hypothetical protein n=1 Tax=Clostridium sp. JN-1 TaxID=2483110 RepID=UPI000F0B0E0D|nr:hypothetical protein [Clostridium sp. JN-1]
MKKWSIILLIILVTSSCMFAKHTYHNIKCKNINYAVQKHVTTGFFNNYRLASINSTKLSFSNGEIAVVKVDGSAYKSPHKRLIYNVFLEKNNKGIWKIKRIYPSQSNSNNSSE